MWCHSLSCLCYSGPVGMWEECGEIKTMQVMNERQEEEDSRITEPPRDTPSGLKSPLPPAPYVCTISQ